MCSFETGPIQKRKRMSVPSPIKYKRWLFIVLILSFFFVTNNCNTTAPASIYHDPAIIHDIFGTSPFCHQEDKFFSVDILPYYQHASGAKNESGVKVPAGDRTGRWNMLGLLHGTAAAPGGALQAGTHDTLIAARTNINNVYSGYTDDTFTDSQRLGHYSIPLIHEKFGIRNKLQFRIGKGFTISIRGGIVSYKQTPNTFNDLTSSSTTLTLDKTTVQNNLMVEPKRSSIANEIGLNIDRYTKTALEDLHVELSWSDRFGMKDEDGVHAVTIIPFVAVGVWLPIGEKKDQDIAFSIPTGNDGFFGGSLQGAINFEFPETIQFGFGGGLTFFDKKNQGSYRVPSSNSQSGIYPWKTSIKKRPGTTWHVFAGFTAQEFLDKLSFYFNYVYTRKEKDSIGMSDTATRNNYFKPKKLEDESSWQSQVIHFGLDYNVTPELSFGFGVQTPITGKKILRTTTLMGNIRFNL